MATDNNRTQGEGNRGGGDGNKGGRRRYFRRRKRKGDDVAAAPAKERPNAPAAPASAGAPAPAASSASSAPSRRTGPRNNRPAKDERGKSSGNNNNSNNNNSNRPRRRRRRSRQDQVDNVATVNESTLDAIAHDYVAPQSVFIYTHVSRPANQGMSEYRAEHFTKAGRRLEDFSIDLSVLFGDNRQKAGTNAGELAEGEVRKKTWQEEWEDAGREELIVEPVTPPSPADTADVNTNEN